MMVHTVLIRKRPGLAAGEIDRLTDRITNLAMATCGEGEFAVGPNVTEEPLDQGYDFGFVLRFPNRGALDAYHVNPAHQAVSLAIRDIAASILVFDLESRP